MQHQIFQLISVICLLANTVVLLVVSYYKASTIQKLGAFLASAAMAVQLGNYFAMFSFEFEGLLHALQLETVGHILVLTAFILFVNEYCGAKIPRLVQIGVVIFNLICIAFCITCRNNTLFFKELIYVSDVEHPYIVATESVLDVGYRIINVILITILSVRVSKRIYNQQNEKKGKDVIILLSIVVSFVADMMSSFDIIAGYDIFPIGIAISTFVLGIAIYKYGILDTIQLAKENVLEQTTEGVIVVDVNKKLVYANAKALNLMPYLDMSNPMLAERNLQEMFEGEHSMIRTEEGQYEAKISPLYENGILKGQMAFLIDMSFIERYTKEITELKEAAEAANRSKSVFLANMSHEIRTPMNAIVGFNELILQKAKTPEIVGYAKDIKTSSNNLLAIINDVLDLSRIESGKMELNEVEYKLDELIKESVLNIKTAAENKGLEFILDVDSNLPYGLYGDNSHIRNILINLLNNAIKYTPTGFVKFIVKLEDIDEEQAIIRFSVADSGIGIKAEDIPKLFDEFEKFDTKKNSGVEGTGLGLTIVKGYSELLGGHVSVESEYGLGSTFTFMVPQKIVCADRMKNCSLIDETEEKATTRRKFKAPNARILVTDDNEINLKVSSSLLRTYGIRVDTATSGREAIDACRTEPYDIIFMDQMMPEMDGVEAMKRIRTLLDDDSYKSIIVALTANAVSGVREQMHREGFDDYITKPIDIAYMEEILLKYLPEELIIDADTNVSVVEEEVSYIVEEQTTESKETKGETFEECLKGFDISKGISCCGGDMECFEEILQLYYESGEKRLEELRSFLESKDYKNYIIAVHGLKSSSASIGATEFSELAKKHEFSGKEEKYDFLHEDFPHLESMYKETLHKIHNALVIKGKIEEASNEANEGNGIELSEEVVQDAVTSIKAMLEEYDYDYALLLIEQLMICKLPLDVKKNIDSLKAAIDDENAKEVFAIIKRM